MTSPLTIPHDFPTPDENETPTSPATNSSFSTKLSTLQLAVDNTSLTTFMTCAFKYRLSIIEGYQPSHESVHLTFGIHMHKAIEIYNLIKIKLQHTFIHPDQLHNETLREVLREMLKQTWDYTHNQPWRSDDSYKNRWTLIRSIVWYLDKHAQDEFETVILASGRPAVELAFHYESGYRSNITGEDFTICGHIDRIIAYNHQYYITDIKTTQSKIDQPNQGYFKKYTPYNQFSLYAQAGRQVFGIPVSGVYVDAIQVLVGESRFERGLAERTEAQLDEWREDLGHWLESMEHYATINYWPKNYNSCDHFGGCPYRLVCAQPSRAAARLMLEGHYTRRIWDPLQRRGDI